MKGKTASCCWQKSPRGPGALRCFFYFGGWWCPTFWFFKSLDNNMVYTLGIYVYIYNYSDKCRKNCCVFNFFIKLKKFSTIFKITLLGCFFVKLTLNLAIISDNLRGKRRFVFFPINFWGDFIIKLKPNSIFWRKVILSGIRF